MDVAAHALEHLGRGNSDEPSASVPGTAISLDYERISLLYRGCARVYAFGVAFSIKAASYDASLAHARAIIASAEKLYMLACAWPLIIRQNQAEL